MEVTSGQYCDESRPRREDEDGQSSDQAIGVGRASAGHPTPVLLNIGLADSPEAPLATLPGLITAVVTVLWGLAWWVTGRTGRRAAENVPAEADRD